MSGPGEKNIEEAISSVLGGSGGRGKVVIVDSSGNVVSDKKLSDLFSDLEVLKGALQSVGGDKLLMVISEDDVGLAKDSTINSVFSVLYNSGKVRASSNDSGLIVSLEKRGKPLVNVFYDVGGAADIYVEISKDNTTWRRLDSVQTTAAKSDILQYPWVAYPYVRVRSPTTGIDIEFEIVVSR